MPSGREERLCHTSDNKTISSLTALFHGSINVDTNMASKSLLHNIMVKWLSDSQSQ